MCGQTRLEFLYQSVSLSKPAYFERLVRLEIFTCKQFCLIEGFSMINKKSKQSAPSGVRYVGIGNFCSVYCGGGKGTAGAALGGWMSGATCTQGLACLLLYR